MLPVTRFVSNHLVFSGILFLLTQSFTKEVGTCTCPSFIGVTIGGGIGRWKGIYGLMIDVLESVRFVATNGSVLTVNENSNPELFWGIRGAGANFGIITEATYKLSKISKDTNGGGQGLTVDFIFPAEKSRAYFQAFEDFGTLPSNLAVITLVLYNDTAGEVCIPAISTVLYAFFASLHLPYKFR